MVGSMATGNQPWCWNIRWGLKYWYTGMRKIKTNGNGLSFWNSVTYLYQQGHASKSFLNSSINQEKNIQIYEPIGGGLHRFLFHLIGKVVQKWKINTFCGVNTHIRLQVTGLSCLWHSIRSSSWHAFSTRSGTRTHTVGCALRIWSNYAVFVIQRKLTF